MNFFNTLRSYVLANHPELVNTRFHDGMASPEWRNNLATIVKDRANQRTLDEQLQQYSNWTVNPNEPGETDATIANLLAAMDRIWDEAIPCDVQFTDSGEVVVTTNDRNIYARLSPHCKTCNVTENGYEINKFQAQLLM